MLIYHNGSVYLVYKNVMLVRKRCKVDPKLEQKTGKEWYGEEKGEKTYSKFSAGKKKTCCHALEAVPVRE